MFGLPFCASCGAALPSAQFRQMRAAASLGKPAGPGPIGWILAALLGDEARPRECCRARLMSFVEWEDPINS